jgi:hypothetical protein
MPELEMTDAELQKAIDAETKNANESVAVPAADEPKEYEIKLATGQVYKGKDRDEAEQKLRHAQEEATSAIRDRENQIRTLMAEKLAAQQPKPNGDSGKFEIEKYHQLLATEPMAAKKYMDSFDPDYQEAMQLIGEQKVAKAAGIFMRRNPEFQDTPENNNLVIERIKEEGGNWTNPDHIEHAYYGLRREGKIKTAEAEPEKAPKATPPPRLGGASPAAKDIPDDDELYGMDDKAFDDFMRKRGLALPGSRR